MPLDTKDPSTCKEYLKHVQNGLYAFVVSTHIPVVAARLPHVKQRIFSASLKGTTPTANSGGKKPSQSRVGRAIMMKTSEISTKHF